MTAPDARRSAPGRPTDSSACRGGRRDDSTAPPADPEYACTVRRRLGMSAEEKALRLAQAEQSIREHALAVEAVRVLEGVARGPMVRSPLTMARALRQLADDLEAAA